MENILQRWSNLEAEFNQLIKEVKLKVTQSQYLPEYSCQQKVWVLQGNRKIDRLILSIDDTLDSIISQEEIKTIVYESSYSSDQPITLKYMTTRYFEYANGFKEEDIWPTKEKAIAALQALFHSQMATFKAKKEQETKYEAERLRAQLEALEKKNL